MRYKNGDFILHAVLAHKELSNTDKIVFTFWLIQARHFHMSSGQMAKQLQKDRRTIRNSLNRLKSLKLLEEIPTSKTNDATKYRITATFSYQISAFVKSRYGPTAGFYLEETKPSGRRP